MADLYNEYKFRSLVHIDHEQYMEEPSTNVDWFPQFAELDARLAAKAQAAQVVRAQGGAS